MSDKRTPNGSTFDYFEPDDMPDRPAFVVLQISGEYSGISWMPQCVADSLEDAMAWMDRNPLTKERYGASDNYEVSVVERIVTEPR